MASCKFCKRLELLKDKGRDLKKKQGINVTFGARVDYRHTVSGYRVDQGVFTERYTLNFCPVCGTKLVRAIRQKKKL